MKLQVHIFRNGKQEVFLPRGIDTTELADVAIEIIRRLSPYDRNLLKHVKRRDETLEVDSVHHNGFFLNGHQYIWGEVYRRVR